MSTEHIQVTDGPAIIHARPYVGATWERRIGAFREGGQILDVSGDAFTVILSDSLGEEVYRLEIDSGIVFEGDGIVWTFDNTQTATLVANDKYTYIVWWVRGGTKYVPVQGGVVTPQKLLVTDL